jgi:hypothetical protein
MNYDKSSTQKLEMSLEGVGNCFIEQGNQQKVVNQHTIFICKCDVISQQFVIKLC